MVDDTQHKTDAVAGDRDAFSCWFQTKIHAGDAESLAAALRELDEHSGQTVAYAFLEAERRHPRGREASPSHRDAATMSRLIALLAESYTPALVTILDEVGVSLREYDFPDRGLELFECMGRSYERDGNLLALARTWMWRGRMHTDRKDRTLDLPCFWRALSIFQHLYVQPGLSESERRAAARGISSVQHGFALMCAPSEDDSLLYNFRALALREKLDLNQLRSGSHHNIGQRYQGRSDFGKALLHYLQAVRFDIGSANDHERRITYTNLGSFVAAMGEKETALAIYRKACTFGLMTFELRVSVATMLLELERHGEAASWLDRQLADEFLAPLHRLQLLGLMVAAHEGAGDGDAAAQCEEEVITKLIECNRRIQINGERAHGRLRERLGRIQGEDAASERQRAVLYFALGETRAGLEAVEAGLRQAGFGTEEAARLAELRDEQVTETEEAPGASAVVPAAAMGKCRACGGDFPAGTEGAQEDLCPLCQEALSLEDLVFIPAGKVVAKDCLVGQVGAFHIDRHPVTNRLFKLHQKACRLDWEPASWQQSLWRLPDQPVTCLNFKDCEAFCAWRSRLTGRTFRLPTQEEWFRAALGDDGRTYPWGNESPDYTRAAYSVVEDRNAPPPPVGLFPAGASPFGVEDMAGTVWEFTSTKDPHGDGWVVYLGGSCDCDADYLTPNQEAYRVMTGMSPEKRTDHQMGFRCVAEGGVP